MAEEAVAADTQPAVQELLTWRPADWSASRTWLDRLRELRDQLPAEYEIPEEGEKPSGATAALLKLWVLGMERVTNPATGRAISGQAVAALAGPGMVTKVLPGKWWREAKARVTPASATAHESLWHGDFTSATSFDVDPADLARLRTEAAEAILTENEERRAAGREDADLRLVLYMPSWAFAKHIEGLKYGEEQLSRLADAQVLDVLRQAGAAAGREPKVSQVVLIRRDGRAHLELLRVPDGGGQPVAHYRGLAVLDVAFMGRYSDLPLAHADRVVAWVEGQAGQALEEGRPMRPVRFTLNPLLDEPKDTRRKREAQFTALVHQGVGNALEERRRAGHPVPDFAGFVPVVKVRYEGKSLQTDLPVRVSSEAEAAALPDGYPGDVVERVWSTTLVSGRAGVLAENRAALFEQFERLIPLFLRRHSLGLRPLDVRLDRTFLGKLGNSDTIDASVGEVARELFAQALEAAQPDRRDKVTPADLGQEFPVGVWNIFGTRAKDPTATQGYWLTVHPDPRPGWTAADYRNAREVDELPSVYGKPALVDVAVWELRQVVAGAVARAVDRAAAAPGKSATVESITLEVKKQARESAQVQPQRVAALPPLVGTLVEAALAGYRGPDGTLAGGVRITPPQVAVVAGKGRSGQTVVRVTVGQEAAGSPGRDSAPRKERPWRVRAEPGQPGLQWSGTRLNGPGVMDPASLPALWSWAKAMAPLLRAWSERSVEPPELQLVSYAGTSRRQEARGQAEKAARKLVLGTLSAVAGRDGLPRPVGYPDQAVSVVLRRWHPWVNGVELWLLPGPGWTMAGYRAAGGLDVVFPPGEVKLDPFVEQRVRWMIAGAAERAVAEGADRFPVELGLLSGPGEENLGEARLRALESLIRDTVVEAVGDVVVAELRSTGVAPEALWPQGMAAGRVVVGDGTPAPTGPGVEPARPRRLVVPSWSSELRVTPLSRRRDGKVAVGRGGGEAPPAEVTFDEGPRGLEEFARRLAEQWRHVPANTAMPDIWLRVALPAKQWRYRDAALDHVSAELRGLLRRHGVDPRGWKFDELVVQAPTLDAQVSVAVTPAVLTTEARVRADSFWQSDFVGRGAVQATGKMRPEGNGLSEAMQQQLTWRVQGFVLRALAPGDAGLVLELGFLVVNQGQAQARQATLEPLVQKAIEGVREIGAWPGGVAGFLRDRVRYRPIRSTQPWEPGVNLRVVESTVEAVAAAETEHGTPDALSPALLLSPVLLPSPDAAGPEIADEDGTIAVTPAGETAPPADGAQDDDFAAFLQNYQDGFTETDGGFGDFGDFLLEEQPFDTGVDAFGVGFGDDGAPVVAGDDAGVDAFGVGFGDDGAPVVAGDDAGVDAFGVGFADDGAPVLTGDDFLRNLQAMAGNAGGAGFGVDDFFAAAFDDHGGSFGPSGSGGFSPVRGISPERAGSAERARARGRASSRAVLE
ncbi:hypothetical protein DMC63_40685, partial [Streptomyces sp. WAC 05977]